MTPNEILTNSANVAVLIDFENAQDVDFQWLFDNVASLGRITVKRAYADWHAFSTHKGKLESFGVEERHQFRTETGGKNASDIMLAVDAMDLLYSQPVDKFIIVTADSDFSTLARRLKTGGKTVIGIGSKSKLGTGKKLVQSCDQYMYYPEKKQKQISITEDAVKLKPTAAVSGKNTKKIFNIVQRAILASAEDTGQAKAAKLIATIRQISPDFDYKALGHSSFSSFLQSFGSELKIEHIPPPNPDLLVSIPQKSKPQKKTVKVTPPKDAGKQIHQAWISKSNANLIQGSTAGIAANKILGTSKLKDSKYKDIDGLLTAFPILTQHWKRIGHTITRIK